VHLVREIAGPAFAMKEHVKREQQGGGAREKGEATLETFEKLIDPDFHLPPAVRRNRGRSGEGVKRPSRKGKQFSETGLEDQQISLSGRDPT